MIPPLRSIARRTMAICALALFGLLALAPQEAKALQSTALTAANLQGKTLRFTITGGNAPFETSGSFTIVFGPNSTYSMPISDGNAAGRSGTYTHRVDNTATTLTLSGYILNSATVQVSIIHTNNDLRSQFEMFTNGANKHGVVVFDTGVAGAPSVTSATTATATTNTPFTYNITTNPAATSYTNSGGNAPVAINPSTGIVTGTFTSAGTFTFSFTANNASGSSPVTTVTVTVTAGGSSGGATGTVTNDALLPANLVGKTLTFSITSPTNTLNDGPETYRVTFESAALLQRTATGFTWNRTTYGATSALGDGNVRLTTITTGGGWDNSATGYAAVITLSQTNGVGRFTTRDINNASRANSGTFTIGSGDSSGGSTVAQYAGRYVGQIGSRVGANVNDTLTNYEVIVSANGSVTVNIGTVVGSLTGTINASGLITFTGGSGLGTFNLRTATIVGTSLSSDYNPALGSSGAQYRFGTSTSFTPASGGAATGFLSNLSVRAPAGAGDATLIVGVTIGGGSGAKGVLIRGVGPALTSFGVAGALADPILNVYQGSALVTTNDDWGTAAGVAATATAVGAFPFTAGSRDAAINAADVAVGSYTIQLTGKGGGTGNALVELYDTTPAASVTSTSSRFTNLSARTFGGTESQTLIVGFNLAGPSARRLLFRAVGPGLAPFGVGGTMPNPKLELYRGQTRIGENDDWAASTLSAQQSVGAFALTAGSRDAVLVHDVQPGSYTVQVTGGTTGVALVEVYELP